MFFASPPSPPTGNDLPAASPTERRLHAEWSTFQRLAERNPQRLTGLTADDLTFSATLRQTPALLPPGGQEPSRPEHAFRIVFPYFFPAAPLELYLQVPLYHPNIHPVTGFVCLWDRHRVSNTVEHALHKLVAILGWRLYNTKTEHVMQPDALARSLDSAEAIASILNAPPLHGLVPPDTGALAEMTSAPATSARRLRLS